MDNKAIPDAMKLAMSSEYGRVVSVPANVALDFRSFVHRQAALKGGGSREVARRQRQLAKRQARDSHA